MLFGESLIPELVVCSDGNVYTFTDTNSVNNKLSTMPFGWLAWCKLLTIIALVELWFTGGCDVVLPFFLIGEGSLPSRSKRTHIV